MHPATVIAKIHVPALHNWLFPANVNLSAIPSALTAMTEIEPTSEQIEMCTSGFVAPYLGATL